MTTLNTQTNIASVSSGISTSGIGNNCEALKAMAQEVHTQSRLQQYRLEQQQEIIDALNAKVQLLEIHKATQLGQDKIIGFMVGAVVLSLLSLATSIFFAPPDAAQASLKLEPAQEYVKG